MSRLPVLLPILILLGSSVVGNAADRDVRVKFPQGASSVLLEGRVKGYDVVRYDLDAKAGQTMNVDFYGTESTCNFVVHAPDGNTIFDELHEPRKFRHKLDATGTYRIIAGMMRVSARRGKSCAFSMNIKITD